MLGTNLKPQKSTLPFPTMTGNGSWSQGWIQKGGSVGISEPYRAPAILILAGAH